MNSEHEQDWGEHLEAGAADDELLALAARLRQAGEATRATPSLAFQRQLRRDLLNQYATTPVKGSRFGRWAGSAAVLGLLAVAVVLTWFSISSAGRLSLGGPPATYQLIDHIVSVAAAPATETVPSGTTLVVDMRWSLPPEAGDVAAFVHLLDAGGQVIAQADVPLEVVTDATADGQATATASLILPADIAAATHQLVAGLYDPTTGNRLPLNGDDGTTTVALGELPAVQPDVAIVPPPPEGTAYLESSGYNAPDGLMPGGMVEFSGRWRIPTDRTTGADVMTFLHLRDAAGAIIVQSDGLLTAEDASAGDPRDGRAAWAGQLTIAIPDDLPSGEYVLVTGLVDANRQRLPVFDLTTGDEIVIGSFTTGEATFTATNVSVLNVSPPAGTALSGTQPITFTVRLAYDGVTPPALLEVKIAETVGENGRGVATAQITLDNAASEVTVPVVLHPAQELNAPAELGLWFQLRATADGPPQLIAMPEAYRWRYTP